MRLSLLRPQPNYLIIPVSILRMYEEKHYWITSYEKNPINQNWLFWRGRRYHLYCLTSPNFQKLSNSDIPSDSHMLYVSSPLENFCLLLLQFIFQLLKLSQASLGQTAAGQLVNLLSNDLQRFDTASLYLHYIWIMPLQAVIAFYVMYRSVGIAALAGMIAMGLEAIPLQGKIFHDL